MQRFKIATAEYRADQKGPLGLISLADLMKYTFAEVTGSPAHPLAWEVACYCQNDACDVEEVRVGVKSRKARPPLHCPLCGKTLEFLHYVESVPLLPVSAGPTQSEAFTVNREGAEHGRQGSPSG